MFGATLYAIEGLKADAEKLIAAGTFASPERRMAIWFSS